MVSHASQYNALRPNWVEYLRDLTCLAIILKKNKSLILFSKSTIMGTGQPAFEWKFVMAFLSLMFERSGMASHDFKPKSVMAYLGLVS